MYLTHIKPYTIFALLLGLLTGLGSTQAAPPASTESVTEHKVVIHVSTDDAKTQKIALNNAVNLQKHYGIDVVPSYFLIDKTGKVVGGYSTALPDDETIRVLLSAEVRPNRGDSKPDER